MKNKLLTVIFGISLAVLIISFSIGIPIYFRPFYYLHIEAYDIPEESGYYYEIIKYSYDALLDYLTIPGEEFSTGVFPYTEEGRSHFEDCKFLFDLNITLFLISLFTVFIFNLLSKKNKIILHKPFGFHVGYITGISTVSVLGLICFLVSLDFTKAFDIFHLILFPGKDNWGFDWYEDKIIRILPIDFFMNCAIIIMLSILILSILMICLSIYKDKRKVIRRKKQ